MSADSQKIREILTEPLTDLDDTLGTSMDDVRLLDDIQARIGGLLTDGQGVAKEIRAVLQERFDDGELRKETYQLVKSMLEKHVNDDQGKSPRGSDRQRSGSSTLSELDDHTAELAGLDAGLTGVNEDAFAATAVIPDHVFQPKSADDQVQVGSVLRDRFLLQERVSGGSMGVVYKALDRRMAEAGAAAPYVAIKILSPQLSQNAQALRALQQEAAKGRCMAHPNIVRFIDLDRDDSLYFIVMEWLDGETLAHILDSSDGKPMDVEHAIVIVKQMASALDYAHRCGIVHADVKPGNIMILPTGTAKLFDFGVARVRQTQKPGDKEFNPSVLGALTPAYSSMQVLTGEEPVPTDDVFSLGCLFYRLVAGYRVFGPRNAAEAAEEGMKPQRPHGLTDNQWRALKKAISFSRVTRFQSMDEFLDALQDHSDETVALEVGEPLGTVEHGGSWGWLLALIALLMLIGFGAFQFGFVEPPAWAGKAQVWIDGKLAALAKFSDELSGEETGEPAPVVEQTPAPDASATSASSPPTAEQSSEISATPDGNDTGTGTLVEDAAEETVLTPAGDTSAADSAIDYSALPMADFEIPLDGMRAEVSPFIVTLRENGSPVTVDLIKTAGVDLPMQLRLEEVGYSGNRSPWASGQYRISPSGVIDIPAGQDRARVTLTMASDPLREADQVSTLRVRQADSTTSQLATIEVNLEDDDQRAFEAGLPTNTIGFAVSQISVRERDPVVQIDVLRFNPDDSQIVVGYEVRDITATEGEDYFSPGGYSVSFGPGQRSARLLIPLVQDSISEGDEAFTVELATHDQEAIDDVFQRIVVIIRDDETVR
ncbi:MAG TPA: protein kinase [Woeseiaceae bacterium]|nr:protein kinase [Woeseiaceae bacterium]